MSVNTDIYILVYKEKKLVQEIELPCFQFMRFDDGIYDQVWDSSKSSEEIDTFSKNHYSLNDKELNILKFKNIDCDIVAEFQDESDFMFPLLNLDNLETPSFYKYLLEKLIRITKNEQLKSNMIFYEESLLKITNLEKDLESGNLNNYLEKEIEQLKSNYQYRLSDKGGSGFEKLAICLLGIMYSLETIPDIQIQIVFFNS